MQKLMTLVLVCLVATAPAMAQSLAGTIGGTIVDSNGLPVPGADAKLTSAETGAERSLVSDEQGVFQFPALIPGTYNLEIEMTSFKKVVKDGLVLTANQRLDTGAIELQLGEMTDVVTVSGRIETVKTKSAERSAVIERTDLYNMPLGSQDPLDLFVLMPGVVQSELPDTTVHRPQRLREMSVMGGRVNNKNYTIDGVNALRNVTN